MLSTLSPGNDWGFFRRTGPADLRRGLPALVLPARRDARLRPRGALSPRKSSPPAARFRHPGTRHSGARHSGTRLPAARRPPRLGGAIPGEHAAGARGGGSGWCTVRRDRYPALLRRPPGPLPRPDARPDVRRRRTGPRADARGAARARLRGTTAFRRAVRVRAHRGAPRSRRSLAIAPRSLRLRRDQARFDRTLRRGDRLRGRDSPPRARARAGRVDLLLAPVPRSRARARRLVARPSTRCRVRQV